MAQANGAAIAAAAPPVAIAAQGQPVQGAMAAAALAEPASVAAGAAPMHVDGMHMVQ